MFDLGDATKWEFFFPSVDQPLLVVPEESSATLGEEKVTTLSLSLSVSAQCVSSLSFHSLCCSSVQKPGDKEDFELAPSWVLPLHISSKG